MTRTGVAQATPNRLTLLAIIAVAVMASCGPKTISTTPNGVYAPGVDLSKSAENGVEVGQRLMAAGQYELAMEAFTRAALEQGLTAEILTGMGTANLGLGRLGQAETLLRRAVEKDENWPEAWNNLGVVLMEQGEITEAQHVFRKAFALDDGQNDSIRENLRVALAKSENADNTVVQNNEYKLVQRGSSDYQIRKTP
jgi:Flp pilus assembly protein TadD